MRVAEDHTDARNTCRLGQIRVASRTIVGQRRVLEFGTGADMYRVAGAVGRVAKHRRPWAVGPIRPQRSTLAAAGIAGGVFLHKHEGIRSTVAYVVHSAFRVVSPRRQSAYLAAQPAEKRVIGREADSTPTSS